ncbi:MULTISPECIES: integrase [unclassified Vibrio]|uniref:integrase n=1 Tax=unclassified Vibrio TaxID=2614977 RepID=UPI00136113A9|nr:integrase [Vibrio sp. V36_P2S2PM302]NAX26717.1 integrase [Vibrio sp. V38_P2S17PM301]NAX29289.1 integrase [Vibrio sp. V37_P2S8PM304]
MAARRRSKGTSHYPEFLLKVQHKGKTRFRFKTIDGAMKLFPVGTTEYQAIQAAMAYNTKHRSYDSVFSLESTSKYSSATQRRDRFDKPLKEWLPIVINRVKSEEDLSAGVLSKFINECAKLEEALGEVNTKTLTLAHLNQFLSDEYGDSAKRTFNGKVSNLKKVFSYLADESAVDFNFMLQKKMKKVTKEDFKKKRRDLTVSDYEQIYAAAPLFLKVAMSLSLQTTHAVREVYRIKYKISEPKEGVCGIVWYDTTKEVDGCPIFGTLYIHREKVKKSDSSFVAIPVTEAIKEIVDLSKTDRLLCPYIVHKKPPPSQRGIAKECTHPYQVHHHNISREFSKVRDKIGLFSELDKSERPTYHEIRRLSANLIEALGESATIRMAHANEKTTKIYTGKRDIVWNEATPITVKF